MIVLSLWLIFSWLVNWHFRKIIFEGFLLGIIWKSKDYLILSIWWFEMTNIYTQVPLSMEFKARLYLWSLSIDKNQWILRVLSSDPVVKDLPCNTGMLVQSLARELRSHMPGGAESFHCNYWVHHNCRVHATQRSCVMWWGSRVPQLRPDTAN